MVSQMKFVVKAEIGECLGCRQTRILRARPNAYPGRADETVTMCATCYQDRLELIDDMLDENGHATRAYFHKPS